MQDEIYADPSYLYTDEEHKVDRAMDYFFDEAVEIMQQSDLFDKIHLYAVMGMKKHLAEALRNRAAEACF